MQCPKDNKYTGSWEQHVLQINIQIVTKHGKYNKYLTYLW